MAKTKVIYRTRREKKRTFRKKPAFTLPLSIVGGLAVPVGKLWTDWRAYKDINVTTREVGQFFTGYDYTTGQFNFASMRFGLMPVMLGALVHKLANRVGVNGMIARAGIPFIRL